MLLSETQVLSEIDYLVQRVELECTFPRSAKFACWTLLWPPVWHRRHFHPPQKLPPPQGPRESRTRGPVSISSTRSHIPYLKVWIRENYCLGQMLFSSPQQFPAKLVHCFHTDWPHFEVLWSIRLHSIRTETKSTFACRTIDVFVLISKMASKFCVDTNRKIAYLVTPAWI